MQQSPSNACEVTSIHLASVLAEEFSNSVVQIACGSNEKEEVHFWVEVDDIVLDLTAYQFKRFEAPIVCNLPSPLELDFRNVTRCTPAEALSNANFELNDLLCAVMNGHRKKEREHA